jgi:hypothetical protein
MVSQMTKWLRALPTDPDITLNLLAAEFEVGDPEDNSQVQSEATLVNPNPVPLQRTAVAVN